jgi:hypothetical protein
MPKWSQPLRTHLIGERVEPTQGPRGSCRMASPRIVGEVGGQRAGSTLEFALLWDGVCPVLAAGAGGAGVCFHILSCKDKRCLISLLYLRTSLNVNRSQRA